MACVRSRTVPPLGHVRPRIGIPNPRVYFGHAHYRFWLEHLDFPTFVYVIRAGLDRPIKVGRACDVFARIDTLQTGNPYPLRLLYVMPGDHELERMLHQRLRGHRTCGEWFAGDELDVFLPEIADLSERMVKAYDGGEAPPPVKRARDRWLVGDETRPPAPPARPRAPLPPPVPPDVALERLKAHWMRPRAKGTPGNGGVPTSII